MTATFLNVCSADSFEVSPEEMTGIFKDTDWHIREFIEAKGAHFVAGIEKKND